MRCLGCDSNQSRPGELYCEDCHNHPERWVRPDEWDAFPYVICANCGEAYLPHKPYLDPPWPPYCYDCWASTFAPPHNRHG